MKTGASSYFINSKFGCHALRVLNFEQGELSRKR